MQENPAQHNQAEERVPKGALPLRAEDSPNPNGQTERSDSHAPGADHGRRARIASQGDEESRPDLRHSDVRLDG